MLKSAPLHWFSKICIAAVLMLGLGSASPRHNFHTALIELEYSTEKQQYDCIFRVFTDDLEAAITKQTGKTFQLKENLKDHNEMLNYLNAKFKLKGSTKTEWQGYMIQNDVCYLNTTYKAPKPCTEISCQLFTELFDDQQTILNYKNPIAKGTLLFNKSDTELKMDL